MRRIALTLSVLFAMSAPSAANSLVPLRELVYSVAATSNGVPYRATVRIAFIGGSAASAMIVDVVEVAETEERRIEGISIDRSGAIVCADRGRLSIAGDAIVALLSLESENMMGVDRGDRWERDGAVPRGRHQTSFAVLRAPSDGYVDLAFARTVTLDDGSRAEWRGKMTYDARTVVPSRIALTGWMRDRDGQAESTRDVSLAIRLTGDSFGGGVR